MPAIERQLGNWGLLPRQEQLTELYFTSPSTLPKKYSAATTLPLGFTVQNHQSQSASYTYTIRMHGPGDGQAIQLTHGTFTLQAGESKQLSVHVQPQDLGSRAYVYVSLSPSEQIGYWLQRGTE